MLVSSVDSTFLELKPVFPNEFIVSDIAETQTGVSTNTTNNINSVINFEKEEKTDLLESKEENNTFDGFFGKFYNVFGKNKLCIRF